MPEYLSPGVYVEEVPSDARTIEAVGTSTAGFIGVADRGPINEATLVTSVGQFRHIFGMPLDITRQDYLGYAVEGFFGEGGSRCYVVRVAHYTDINSRVTLSASSASLVLNNESAAPALTIRAASEGQWGERVYVRVRNSSKFGTNLVNALSNTTVTDRIQVRDASGIRPGSVVSIISPIVTTIVHVPMPPPAPGFLRVPPAVLPTGTTGTTAVFYDEATSSQVASSTPIDFSTAGTGRVMTPDFRYIEVATASVSLDSSANTDLIGLPDNDIFGHHLTDGETIWLVEPAREINAVVDHIEEISGGPQAFVVFTANITSTFNFPAETRVVTRDFELGVLERASAPAQTAEAQQTYESLSLVSAHPDDFVQDQLNEGATASQLVRATVTAGTLPLANLSWTVLARETGVADATAADGLTTITATDYIGSPLAETGIHALDGIDDVNIVAVPHPRFFPLDPNGLISVYKALLTYCENRRYLFAVIDSQENQTSDAALTFRNAMGASAYGAFYYPWLRQTPPGESLASPIPPSGHVAGIYAFTDRRRGVHKAPAGTDDGRVKAATGVERQVSKGEQDGLNNQGVNAIRRFANYGTVVWGSRTLSSDASLRYVPIRRFLNMVENSIDSATWWAVFEPNDPGLWRKIERNLRGFLRVLWRDGALFGDLEDQAFRVKCDAETNTTETIEAGQVITEVKLATITPAEFVIFRITQTPAGATISE